MNTFSSSSERPTLPSLHTLDLPTLARKPRLSGAAHDLERHSCSPYTNAPHARQFSTSSTCTSSRTPSPTPSSSSFSSSSSSHSGKFRLVPSTFDDANAFIVIPPPHAPVIPSLQGESPTVAPPASQRALLLVGPSAEHCRHPQRQIAKGARVHPYRIVPTNGGRKTSTICV